MLLGSNLHAQQSILSEMGNTTSIQQGVMSPCAPITQFPWTEGFEVTFPAAVAPGNAAAPSCWINFNEGSSSYLWRRTTTSSYVRTGAAAAQHYTSASTATNDYLVTPVITLTGNERLRFYVKGYSTYIDHLRVGIYNIAQNGHDLTAITDTSLFTTILPNTFIPQHEWTEIIINLNNYVGDFRIAFIRDLIGGYYLNLDDVTIETIPTCPQPTLAPFTIGETSAIINWTPGNVSQTTFYLYYKETVAANYDSIVVSGNTYTLQNLISGTSYNFYVKADCGIEFSAPTPVKTFNTLCPPITTLPVSESFDTYTTGTGAFPSCWYRLSTHIDYPYLSTTNSSPPASMYFYSNYPGAYNIAISPKIDSSIPISNLKASLKVRAAGLDDTLFVGVMTDPYDISTFEQVGIITVPAITIYHDKEFYFTSYTGTGQFIAIKNAYGTTSSTMYVDNIVLDVPPACANPTGLHTSNVTHNQLNLGWLENGTATTWNVEYGLTGFTPGTGTLLTGVTTNPLLINNLTPQTTYQFYVQADCGAGVLSPWSNPLSITTACAPLMAVPYSEPFDSYGTGTGSFPTCWTKLGSSTTYPYISTTSFAGAGSLYLYNSGSGNYNYAILPAFDASIPVNTLQMTYKFRASGTDDTLYVGVMSDPLDMNSFTVVETYTVPITSTWYDQLTFLNSYTGIGQNIAFKSTYGATSSIIYVDNLVINTIPNCLQPTNLSVSNLLSTSVDLNWTENGTATSWNIEYGPLGFVQGSGTLVTGITDNPFNITGLIPQTEYLVYVQSVCGSDVSSWSTPLTFTTACAPISSIPYAELFDSYGSSTFPTCWTSLSYNTTFPTLSTTSPFSGTRSLYFTNATSGYWKIAISPQIDPSIDLNTLKLNFMLKVSGTDDTLYVGVISDITDPNSFETIAKLTLSSTSSWTPQEVFLSTYTGTARYVAIKGSYGATPSTIYVDDFVISTMPTCPSPTNLEASNVNTTGFDLSWTENGSATSWNIEYGPVGFLQGTGTMITNTSYPYNFSNLLAGNTYQFYVQSDCGSELSAWSAPFEITIECDEVTVLPWTENFDTYSTGTGAFPTCWKKFSTSTTFPYINTTNYEGIGSLYMYVGTSGNYMFAISQKFSASIPLNTLNLNFKMRATGTDDTLYIGTISDPTDISSFEELSKYTLGTTGTWYDIDYSFENYLGSNQYIAFRTSYGATSSTIYIDNVVVDLIPTCKKPKNVSHTNTTQTSVDLSWTQEGSASSWNIEYGIHDFTPGTGQIITGITTNPYTLSGLQPNTYYDVYIQANCGAGDLSPLSFKYSFLTGCGIVTTLPFIETFDAYGTGTTVFPTCWTKVSTATTYPYVNTINYSAPGAMYFYCGSSGNYNYVISPQFSTSIPLNTLQLDFQFRATGTDDTLYVGVMSSPTDITTFELVAKLNVTTTGVFDEVLVSLASYTGTGTYIALFAQYGSSSSTIYVDNLVIAPIPSCAKPVNLTVANVDQTSADLIWTENGNATLWNIEYGPTGFALGSGTVITGLTDTIYHLSGLTAETVYDFYVTADCGAGMLSQPSNPFTFNTTCIPITTIPWIENFDSYATGSANYPMCWKKISSYVTNSYPYISSSYSSSPSNSMYLYAGTSGNYNYVIAPMIDPSIPLNTLRVNFKMRASGTDDTLYVGIMTDPYDASTFEVVDKKTVNTISFFEDEEVYFSNYTGTGQYIAFKSSYGASSSTIYLDNIVVNTLPDCIPPSNVTALNITSSSADIHWVENGGSTEWQLEYGAFGFTPGNGTLITSLVDTFYSISGLLPLTTYQVYVKAICGGGMESNWSAVYSFTTTCPAITTIPYTENFDTYTTGTGSFPTCWTKLSSYAATSYPYLSTTNFSAPASMYLYSATSGYYNLVISPTFDATIPVNTLKATFKYRVSGADDTLYVGVISDINDLNTFETISKITSSTTGTWLDGEVFFSSYSGIGQNIAFKNSYGATSSIIYIDNLLIDLIPPCPKPSNLVATNIQTNSFNLGFTENGTATNWIIEYGPVGFVLGTGTTITGVTSIPYNVTGLSAQTTYQFYVKSDCGGGDVSVWSAPITVTTSCVDITSIPWTDFFDTYPTTGNYFPVCWTRNTTYANRPYIRDISFSGTGSMYFYAGTAGTYNIAATPMIDPTIQINTLTATFKYRTYYLTDTMYVGVMTDPSDASTFELVHHFGAPQTGTFYDREVQFNNYTGNGHYIAFKIQHHGSQVTYAYMDNLTIDYIPTCPKPIDLIASNTTQTSVDLTWTEVGTATTWKVEFGPSGFTPGTGTSIITNLNQYSLVGLTPATCYDFYVRSMCSASDSSVLSVKGLFCTNQVPATVPISIDFETPSGFTLVNNVAGNNWYIGTDTAHTVNNTSGGQNALYISNDNGLTNTYTIANSAAVVWAYRDVYFAPSSADYVLSFDWRLYGETDNWDYMNVYAGPLNTPTPLYLSYNIIPPVGSDTLASYINLQSTYQTKTIILPQAQYSGQTKRIFFCWRNDSADGTQPPAAVDNISITSSGISNCDAPTNVAVSSITASGATVTWTPGGTETSWQVEYKVSTSSNWTIPTPVSTPTILLQGLQNNTTYDVRVKALCNPGESVYTSSVQFTTTGGTVTFTITATATGPGTITPTGAVSVVSGSNQLFTFTPNTGCEVSTLLIDNILVTNPGLSYNFSNVTTDHTIQVTFGTIGINESEIAQLVELFPNPTSAFIDIKVKNDQLLVKETKLFDMYGKLIQFVELHDNNARVDVSHLSAGVYFIKMDSAKGTITKKFIKK